MKLKTGAINHLSGYELLIYTRTNRQLHPLSPKQSPCQATTSTKESRGEKVFDKETKIE
jgi:hypothetical protein